jgi:hypothetical protein
MGNDIAEACQQFGRRFLPFEPVEQRSALHKSGRQTIILM